MPAAGALAVLLATMAFAGANAQPTRAAAESSLLRSLFGGTFVRAEVIVQEGNGVRDLRVDRGRIKSLAPRQLRLVERDGTSVSIAVSAATSVSTGGAGASYSALRRGMSVTTVRAAEQTALYVAQPPQALPKAADTLLFGSQMIRAEVILRAGAERDVRLDHGEIVALRPRVVRLREQDGRLVALPVAKNATITLDGRKAPWSWLRTGMTATVMHDGDDEASVLQASAGAR